jgi:hypothetical protein
VTIVETRRPGFSITRLAHWIVLSWGWRRALVAFSAGAVSMLAMAPFDAWPVLFFTFPILVWLVDGAAGGRLGGLPSAAIAGWWFGFGFPRRALLGRLRVSGRCQNLRLAVAVRRHRAAGGHGLLHRPRPRARSHAVDARADAADRACGRAHRRQWLRGHLFSGFPGTSMAMR